MGESTVSGQAGRERSWCRASTSHHQRALAGGANGWGGGRRRGVESGGESYVRGMKAAFRHAAISLLLTPEHFKVWCRNSLRVCIIHTEQV